MKNLKAYLYLALLLLLSSPLKAQTRIIAHRGYWKTAGSAQNSIAALLKADSIKVYGSEVDIRLTADGIPVCHHDADIEINGRKVVVEENSFQTIRQAKLSNGEPVATLEEYLQALAHCRHTKLIIELKTHKNKSDEDKLANIVVKMVKDNALSNRVEYISFGINLVTQLKTLAPEAPVYYLNGDLAPQEIEKMALAGIDYHFSLLGKNPQWIAESHKRGLKINTWTVNNAEDIDRMLDLNVDFITTDEPLLVRELINKRQ